MSDRDFNAWTASLPDAQFTFTGTFDPGTAPASPVPMRYVAPRRRRLRWEIVEYSGMVTPTDTTEDSLTFQATGPITRIVHRRRFWLLWSAKRYLRRLQPTVTTQTEHVPRHTRPGRQVTVPELHGHWVGDHSTCDPDGYQSCAEADEKRLNQWLPRDAPILLDPSLIFAPKED